MKNSGGLSGTSRIGEIVFYALALKPAAGFFVFLGGDWWAQNQSGISAAMPATVSIVLLALALVGRKQMFLSRVTSWVWMLSAAAFSNRAFRDFGDDGIWTPQIEYLVAVPIAMLLFTGTLWRELRSWNLRIQTSASGLILAVLGATPLIWDRYPSYSEILAVVCYGGLMVSAIASTSLFTSKIKETPA